ncbi:thymidylate synthase [Pseudobutyrivibrio sp.]
MSKIDIVYNNLVKDVLENGYSDANSDVRPVWRDDGQSAHSKFLISREINIDVSEVPLLTSKKVAWKSSIHEILWFFVFRTSLTEYLENHNVGIWKEWTRDGNIGKAYGYQAGKPVINIDGKMVDQVDYLIYTLSTDPASRRHMTMFWNIDDLQDMNLPPCWFGTQWMVVEGKLYIKTYARSCDLFLGTPFNIFQYYVLLRMVSQVTGIPVGGMICNMSYPHVYDKHMDLITEQIELPTYNAPILNINPDVKNLRDFRIEDFELIGYDEDNRGPAIKGDVAV